MDGIRTAGAARVVRGRGTSGPDSGPRLSGPRRPTLRDRWLALRDRLLTSPAFHRRAAAFPLTRPFVRRDARALFDVVAGFTYSQVLLACVRLRVFDTLADGPLAADELARRIGLPADGAARLFAAAASLHLIEARDDGRWGLGRMGAPIVALPSVAAMVEHHATLYQDLTDPVALLRGERDTSMSGYWPYADTTPGAVPERLDTSRVAEYSELMAVTQPMVAEQVLDAYPLARHRRLLDVGGGDGAFLMKVAERAPDLELMLFDLPAVAERAQARFARAGLAHRAQAHGGSFLTDPLPAGADVITLVRVLFDHPDERVLAILRAARAALPEHGTLLVCEPMSGTPGAEAIGDAYYGLYLLAMGKGRSRTPARIESLLHDAGFSSVDLLPTRLPLQTRVLRAHP
jgi:demethylspheroidene O-methyltransferase